MTNYQYLNDINAKIISYKSNNQNPIYYVYIGPVFGYNNKPECGIFLKITHKLFSNYQGNEVYELLNEENWNGDQFTYNGRSFALQFGYTINIFKEIM